MRVIQDNQLISLTLASGEFVRKREISLIAQFERKELDLHREPKARRKQKHIPGLFWVSQLDEHVWYESRLEMFILKQLDFTKKIIDILPQPFALHYREGDKLRLHIPDFLVWLEGNRRLLINVKPKTQLWKPLSLRSFKACVELSTTLGWDYATLSEPEPIFLANLNWLAGYRRIPENFSTFASVIVEKATLRQTVQQLLADLGPQALVRPVLFHLMWLRHLDFDTHQLLSNSSEVWLAA